MNTSITKIEYEEIIQSFKTEKEAKSFSSLHFKEVDKTTIIIAKWCRKQASTSSYI
jgi:hypothetical protein